MTTATTRRTLLRSVAATLPLLSGTATADAAAEAPTPAGRRVIIDTDCGTDDALALLLAVHAPNLTIEAVTIVVGNVGFAQQAKNALYTLQIAGRGGQIPVFEGSTRPILRQTHVTASYVHGHDGLGDSNFPDPVQKPERENGVDTIIRLARAHPGEISMICIGPLTNLALAILQEPRLPQLLEGVVFMGGFTNFYGNVTPAATFNIWTDPEAAAVVFGSGIRITTVGFDVSVRSSVIDDADYARIEAMGTPLSHFFVQINRVRRAFCKQHQKMAGPNQGDGLATACAVDPRVMARTIDRAVQIEVASPLTRGMMVVDELGVWNQPPNATICVEADEARFKRMVFEVLGRS